MAYLIVRRHVLYEKVEVLFLIDPGRFVYTGRCEIRCPSFQFDSPPRTS